MSSTTSTPAAKATTRRQPKATEPSAEATPAPEPKPTRSSAQPRKRTPKAKAKAAEAPQCPRKHTAEGAIARCAAYYERNGHFKPSHMKAAPATTADA